MREVIGGAGIGAMIWGAIFLFTFRWNIGAGLCAIGITALLCCIMMGQKRS